MQFLSILNKIPHIKKYYFQFQSLNRFIYYISNIYSLIINLINIIAITESDFHSNASITVIVMAGSSKNCTDFLDLVVDDNSSLEEDEVFTIIVGSSVATVIMVDDEGM